ncbi:MAG: imidazole glycerol phosphate synthase subunit HisH [Clostridia bacterium]
MTAIIDYGVGNLFSLVSSFNFIGENAVITNDKNIIEQSDRIVLPGVGAFSDAALKLANSGMGELVTELAKNGKPLLGICLGMQLLFDKSSEYGTHKGLGLIKGQIIPIPKSENIDLKIPHIGWNALLLTENKSCLLKYIDERDFVYFVHSYYASYCEESVIASTDYGTRLTAAVQNKNVFGTQFHPEKSGTVGLNILRAFCEIN